jgi:hypothetical protein
MLQLPGLFGRPSALDPFLINNATRKRKMWSERQRKGSASMTKLGIASAMALFLTGTANAQYRPSDPLAGEVPTYAVGGIALGSRVKLDSSTSREYKCGPSEQFEGLTWCQKMLRSSEQRHPFEATYSILHSKDGTILYANRYQQPAFFDAHKIDQEIQSYSRKFGGSPQITRMPHRSRTSDAIMATWGKVELQPLDSDGVKLLAEGKSPKKGLLIDFLGNFARSAQEGLPIYRIIGGAGFVRVSSFDQKGRGIVRVAVVDASTFQPNLGLPSAQPLTGSQRDDQRPLMNQEELAAATKARNDTEAELAAAIKTRRDAEAAVERLQAELSAAINERAQADAAKKQIGNLMPVSGPSQPDVDVTVFIWICATAILLFVVWVLCRLLHTSPKHSVDAGRIGAGLEVRHDYADGALAQLSTASGSSAETEPSIDQGDLVKRGAISADTAVPTVERSGVPTLGGIRQHTDPVQSSVDEVETERARAAKVDGHDLQLAIDPTTKEIVIQDLLRLGDADSRLVQELHNIYQQDLSAGRTAENHQYLTSHKLADSLKLAERTVRQRVSRCRITLRESYKQKFGQDPPKHLLIENKARQGYRLNPQIRFVAIAKLEPSVSASHKPAQAEPRGIS